MTWGQYDFKLMIAKTNDFVVLEEMTDGREVVIQLQLIESLGLLLEVLHQTFVQRRHLGLQAECCMDGVIAEIMVQMTMSDKEMNRLSSFSLI